MAKRKKRGRLTKLANVTRRLWRVRLSNTARPRRERKQKSPRGRASFAKAKMGVSSQPVDKMRTHQRRCAL